MQYLNFVDSRVWWIPQVPMEAFYVPVKTVEEALLILDTLARYDMFQFEKNVKPDYSNVGGLQVQEELNGEWSEYEDDEGRDIDDIMKERAEA